MDLDFLVNFEKLKISAFSKYSQLNDKDIHNVTLGPRSETSPNKTTQNPPQKTSKTPRTPRSSARTRLQSEDMQTQAHIHHLLHNLEIDRQLKVQNAVRDRYNKFEEFTRQQQQAQQDEWCAKQHEFIKNMQHKEDIILQTMNEQTPQQDEPNRQLENEKLMMQQRKLQYEEQMRQNKEKQRILASNIEKIRKSQVEFQAIYQEIMATMKSTQSEDLKKYFGEKNIELVRSLPKSFDAILSHCKKFTVGEDQVKQAEQLLTPIKDLRQEIQEAVLKIEQDHQEAEKQKAASAAAIAVTTPTTTHVKVPTKASSSAHYKTYCEAINFVAEYAKKFQNLDKQFRNDCNIGITIPVNAISDRSPDHLRDKFKRLSNLLNGHTVIINSRQVNASRYPEGVPFCMDALARKFVSQGDILIDSNPTAAFCYATVIVSLWSDFRDFGPLLLGYFYKKCPYLVPYYAPKVEGESDEDYYTKLGYNYTNNQIEKQDKFLKRMTGILRLYFAILIVRGRNRIASPHNLKQGWRLLSAILKLEPRVDITATVLHVFFETVGFQMEATYGGPFRKLVKIVNDKFLPHLKEIDTGGPVTRLEMLMQEYRKKGGFQRPHGLLPDNFW